MEMYLSRKEYTLEHPIDADLLMGVFDGGALETRTMSRVGCLDYSARPRPRGRSRGRGSWSGMSATSSTGTCLSSAARWSAPSSQVRGGGGGGYTPSSTSPSATASGYVRASCYKRSVSGTRTR